MEHGNILSGSQGEKVLSLVVLDQIIEAVKLSNYTTFGINNRRIKILTRSSIFIFPNPRSLI